MARSGNRSFYELPFRFVHNEIENGLLIIVSAVTLSLSDEDFAKMTAGKTQAQRLFMSGKLKIKGDIMKATKMEPIMKKAQTNAKL